MSSVDHLVQLGLSRNEAKALDALTSIGPAGASDVHRHTGIPRNKAYEALERLANRGMVEVQNGHPTLYRAAGPEAVIGTLVENYGKEAKQALKAMETRQAEPADGRENGASASAWVVRGELGVRRRLAELIYEAKSDIFAIGGYPPKYLLTAKTALKAAAKRGIATRAICMMRPGVDVQVSPEDGAVIEFRTVKAAPTLKLSMEPLDEKLINTFAGMSGAGAMVVIDEEVAFDIVDDGVSAQKTAGIVFQAPGIPRIQKATVERILALYTRKL